MRIRFGYPTKRTRRNSGYFQGHTSILSITLYLLIYQRLDWTSSITNLRTAFKGPNCYFFLAVNGRGFQVWENKLHHQGLHSSAARWDDQLDGGHFLCGGRPGPKRAQATWRWLAQGLLFQLFSLLWSPFYARFCLMPPVSMERYELPHRKEAPNFVKYRIS